MKPQVIRSKDLEPLTRDSLEIRKLVGDLSDVSIATVKISGEDRTIIDTISDTFDYVVEGSGKFVINGEEHSVGAGDLVQVPKGTEFSHSGQMTLLAVHSPAFDPDGVREVDKN